MKLKKNLIGISGKMGAGKDTAGKIIQKLHPEFELKSFAHKVKVVCSILTGFPVGNFYDPGFKDSTLPEEWNHRIRANTGNNKGNIIFDKPLTVREMLQKVGTDCLRDNLHKNVWVNALLSEYDKLHLVKSDQPTLDFAAEETHIYPYWIITDVRFPNEVEAIQDRGGIVIRLTRETTEAINGIHESETALDNFTHWNHIIDNRDGDLERLEENIKKIISAYE